jgi:hypothetical protein
MNGDADGPIYCSQVSAPGRGTVEVRTAYAYGDCPWHELDESGRAWWRDWLEEMHAAEVELAGLPDEQRMLAEQMFHGQEVELEDMPAALHKCACTAQEEGGR